MLYLYNKASPVTCDVTCAWEKATAVTQRIKLIYKASVLRVDGK